MDDRTIDIIERLGVWVLGQTLPRASVLRRALKRFMWGLALLLIGGIMCTILLVLGFYGIWLVLAEYGANRATLYATMAACITLSIIGFFLAANRMFNRLIEMKSRLALFSGEGRRTLHRVEDILYLLLQGFIAGLANKEGANGPACGEASRASGEKGAASGGSSV